MTAAQGYHCYESFQKAIQAISTLSYAIRIALCGTRIYRLELLGLYGLVNIHFCR